MNNKEKMDALVWLGPREMEFRREPLPAPAEGEALIRVHSVGVCGSEMSGYLGESSIRKPPLIMGHEFAGVIERAAPGRLADGGEAREGQRVAVNPLISCGACRFCLDGRPNICPTRSLTGAHRPGAFADYVAVPLSQCWPMPDGMSYEAGAMAEPMACAVRAIHRARLSAGETVLILGAGVIGLFCLIECKALGAARILVSDINEGRLEIAERHGAGAVFDSRREDVVAATMGEFPDGADVVVDAVGLEVTRAQAMQAVRPGGRILALGMHQEHSPAPFEKLIRRESEMIGSYAYTDRDFARALGHLGAGLIRPGADWMDERPLAAGRSAFEDLLGDTFPKSKILLRVG